MGISYKEIVSLNNEFDRQCDAMGVRWKEWETMEECLSDFISQYENCDLNPKVRLCGYGYEIIK